MSRGCRGRDSVHDPVDEVAGYIHPVGCCKEEIPAGKGEVEVGSSEEAGRAGAADGAKEKLHLPWVACPPQRGSCLGAAYAEANGVRCGRLWKVAAFRSWGQPREGQKCWFPVVVDQRVQDRS